MAASMRAAALEAALADRHAGLVGAATPLDELADEFDLSQLACHVLLVCAAPVLWGELARLYGILCNDPARPLVDELLVGQIVGRARADRHEVSREVDPQAPLVRHGLICVGEGRNRPFLPLHVDPIAIGRLRGESAPALGRDDPVTVRDADCALDDLLIPESLLRIWLGKLASGSSRPVRLVARGRLGAGRRTLLAALARTARRRLGVIDTTVLPREPRAFVDALRAEVRRTALRGWLPCVSGLDAMIKDDSDARDPVRDLFRSHPGPIAFRVGPDKRPPLDPGYLVLDIPALGEGARARAWQAALKRHGRRSETDVKLLRNSATGSFAGDRVFCAAA